MNKLYISDCRIYFKTNAKTCEEATDGFLRKCADPGIEIVIERSELRDEDGEEIEE